MEAGILEKLQLPFSVDQIKLKIQSKLRNDSNKGVIVPYVDARVVMDRLDEVCGPNWSDDYRVIDIGGKYGVECALTIYGVTRRDVGEPVASYNGEIDVKAGYSDALKRAAVRFGVGRFLYDMPVMYARIEGNYIHRDESPELQKKVARYVEGIVGKQAQKPAMPGRASHMINTRENTLQAEYDPDTGWSDELDNVPGLPNDATDDIPIEVNGFVSDDDINDCSPRQRSYIYGLLKELGVWEGDKRALVAVVLGEQIDTKVASEQIETLKSADKLPAVWLHAYVRCLREVAGVSQDSVVEFLTEHSAEKPAELDREGQEALIGFLKMKQEAQAEEGSAPMQVSPDMWRELVGGVAMKTGHSEAAVNAWMMSSHEIPEDRPYAVISEAGPEIYRRFKTMSVVKIKQYLDRGQALVEDGPTQ